MRHIISLIFYTMIMAAISINALCMPIEQGIQQTFKDIKPYVVKIEVSEKSSDQYNPFAMQGFNQTTATGIILGDERLILTNRHTVNEETNGEITITFSDGSTSKGEYVGSDEYADLALLRADSLSQEYTPVQWADSDSVEVGQFVLGVGVPLKLDYSLSFGIVSYVDRDMGQLDGVPHIQTDFSNAGGSSGGPVLNLRGEIIGIISKGDNGGRFGFAIPANSIQASIEKMKEGTVPLPHLGIVIAKMPEEFREFFDDESLNGLIFYRTTVIQPMQDCPLESGDLIIAMDGKEFDCEPENAGSLYQRYLREAEVGNTIELTVWRFGEIFNFKVPVLAKAEKKEIEVLDCENWGIEVKELRPLDKANQAFLTDVELGMPIIDNLKTQEGNGTSLEVGEVIIGIFEDGKVVPIKDMQEMKDAYERHKDDDLILLRLQAQNMVYQCIVHKQKDDEPRLEY